MQKHENDKSLCPFCGTFLHRNASIMFTPIPWFRCSRFVSSRLFRDWNFLKGLIDWLVFDRNKRSGLTVSEWSSTSGKTWTYNPNISASDRIIGVYISYGWHGFDSVCFYVFTIIIIFIGFVSIWWILQSQAARSSEDIINILGYYAKTLNLHHCVDREWRQNLLSHWATRNHDNPQRFDIYELIVRIGPMAISVWMISRIWIL